MTTKYVRFSRCGYFTQTVAVDVPDDAKDDLAIDMASEALTFEGWTFTGGMEDRAEFEEFTDGSTA